MPLAEKGDWFAVDAEQQLLRFTAGAGITTDFNPKTRAISLNAEAETDFALLEGKVGCTVSLPGSDGYDVVIQMPKKGSGEIIDLPLGAFLIEIETALTGYAGAKAIACADLSFSMKQGRLLLNGINSTEARQLKKKDPLSLRAKRKSTPLPVSRPALEVETGLPFDLPSEAQWEYAARSEGKNILFATDTGCLDLGRNFPKTEDEVSIPGLFPPNSLGLYNMSGNVIEWVNDWYDENYYINSPRKNPPGPADGSLKVLRGGSYLEDPIGGNVYIRQEMSPELGYSAIGFRCALNIIDPPEVFHKRAQQILKKR